MDIFTDFGNSVQKQATVEKAKGPLDSETDLGQTMEGYGYEHFGADEAMESQQVDYRRIVGDTQPPRTSVSSGEGEHFVRRTSHSHGHETAAQRYSATRIQVGLGPERWVAGKPYGEWATFRYFLPASVRVLQKKIKNKQKINFPPQNLQIEDQFWF